MEQSNERMSSTSEMVETVVELQNEECAPSPARPATVFDATEVKSAESSEEQNSPPKNLELVGDRVSSLKDSDYASILARSKSIQNYWSVNNRVFARETGNPDWSIGSRPIVKADEAQIKISSLGIWDQTGPAGSDQSIIGRSRIRGEISFHLADMFDSNLNDDASEREQRKTPEKVETVKSDFDPEISSNTDSDCSSEAPPPSSNVTNEMFRDLAEDLLTSCIKSATFRSGETYRDRVAGYLCVLQLLINAVNDTIGPSTVDPKIDQSTVFPTENVPELAVIPLTENVSGATLPTNRTFGEFLAWNFEPETSVTCSSCGDNWSSCTTCGHEACMTCISEIARTSSRAINCPACTAMLFSLDTDEDFLGLSSADHDRPQVDQPVANRLIKVASIVLAMIFLLCEFLGLMIDIFKAVFWRLFGGSVATNASSVFWLSILMFGPGVFVKSYAVAMLFIVAK